MISETSGGFSQGDNGEDCVKKAIASFFNCIAVTLMTLCLTMCIIGVLYKQSGYFRAFDMMIGLTALAIEIVFLFYLSAKAKSDRHALGVISAISIVVLFSWNCVFDPKPVSDYAVLVEGAQQIINGSFVQRVSEPSDYFSIYNFQIGYAFYLSVLLRVFNGSLNALRNVQIVVVILTGIVIYKTFRLYFSVRKSLFSALLFVLFPYIFLGSGILNNQHESLLFIALAVYVFLAHRTYRGCMLSASLLSIGNVLRPTSTIVWCALVATTIIYGFVYRKRECFVRAFVQMITFIALSGLINGAFILLEYAPKGINAENLWFKVLLGLTGKGLTGQVSTDAIHTNLYYDLLHYDFDYVSYQLAAKNYLLELIKNHTLDYRWIGKSFLDFLGGIDNQVYYGNEDFVSQNWLLMNVLNVVGTGIYAISLISSLFTAVRRKIIDNPLLVVTALIFGGYFFVYLVFEKQTRYRYEQYYALFLFGIPMLIEALQMITQRMKRCFFR